MKNRNFFLFFSLPHHLQNSHHGNFDSIENHIEINNLSLIFRKIYFLILYKI